MSYEISKEIKETLDRYVNDRIPTGGFLRAVLANDLFEAVGRADIFNQRALVQICGYIYNDIPSSCWGSYEIVDKWLEKGGE